MHGGPGGGWQGPDDRPGFGTPTPVATPESN